MNAGNIGRQGFLISTACALTACSSLSQSATANTSAAKTPNVVFFLIDDMGWKNLGSYGAKLYETPHMDRLAESVMRFPQAYTSAPNCAPARATALTGRNPMKMRMWNHMHFIPGEQKILPQYLKAAGYQTWHVGKWHMGGPDNNTMPTDLGFDVNIGGWISWGPGSYFRPYRFYQWTSVQIKTKRRIVEL